MKKTNRYLSFWSSIPLVLISGWVFNTDFDIGYLDTYYVFELIQISIIFSFYLFLSGFGYYVFKGREQISKILFYIHLGLSIFAFLLMILPSVYEYFFNPYPNYWFSYIENDKSKENIIDSFMFANKYTILKTQGFVLGLVITIIGFISYSMNMLITIIKMIKEKHS